MWNLFYTVDVSVILITLDFTQLSVIDFLLPLMHSVFLFVFLKQQDKTQASRRTDALNNKMVVFWCNTIFHLASEQLRVITSNDLNTS